MTAREGDLEFEFEGCQAWRKLDRQGVSMPHGMSFVDSVVEEPERRLLVEVKDPSCGGARPKDKAAFRREMIADTLIHDSLAPKCRDSYTYLHLVKEDDKSFIYVVVLGTEQLGLDAAVLPSFKDRLLSRLRQEGSEPWRRQYVADCIVVTPTTWAQHFPEYRLRRIP